MATCSSVRLLQFLGGAVVGTATGFAVAQQVHFATGSDVDRLGPCWALARSSPTEAEPCIESPADIANLSVVERTIVLCQELGFGGGITEVSESAARTCKSLDFRDCSEGHLSALSCLEAER